MSGAILLTGGNGFLGSNLLSRLIENGKQIIVLKRRESNLWRIRAWEEQIRFYNIEEQAFPRLFEENKVETIIHCATNYGRREVSPTDIIEANLILPLHLLQMAALYGVRAFVNTDTILDKRINYYSLSKHQFCDWLALFSERFVCANVALEHFYGPMDDTSKFVTKIITDLLANTESLDLTPGQQKRDFIYIDDVTAAFMKIIEFSGQARPGLYRFEVGSAENIAICEFVEMVKQITGNTTTRLNFGALPYRKNEVMESKVDVSALQGLGWTPSVPLRDGLEKTIYLEKQKRRMIK